MGGIQTESLITGPSATAITPEMQALATNLNNDPVAIYNFVRNKIRFQPYRGSCKGAHTTFVDGAGNDMDQASLLIALLNAAGYSNTLYVYGQIAVPDASSDEYDLSHWLGTTAYRAPWVLDYAATPGMSYYDFGGFLVWWFDHMWVRVTIAGTTYDIDPSFKTSELLARLDCKTISGYNQTQLVTDAAGTVGTNYIQNMNRSAIEGRLGQYASTLRNYIKSNLPNARTEDILGGSGDIVERTATSLSDAASMLDELVPSETTNYALLPASYKSTLTVKVGTQIDATFNTDSLQSNRLSLVFSGVNAQLWLGDTMVVAETNGSGTTASVTLSVTQPDTTLSQNLPASPYLRSGSYDMTYAFYPNPYSNGEIEASDTKLQNYLASGLTDTSRQVLTEALHGLGLKWVRRATAGNDIVSKVNACYVWTDHIFGLTGQDTGYWVDMPACRLTSFNDGYTQADFTKMEEVFKASVLVASAMEHGVIEQNGGNASLSTVKCLTLANDSGQKIFRVTPSTWSSISSQLTNYTTAEKTFIGNYVTIAGNVSLVHENGQTTLNQWKGYGFAAMSTDFVSVLIKGGYAGGYNSTSGILSGASLNVFNGTLTEEIAHPLGVTPARSKEPVDLATGAYTMAVTDLALGEANTPRGLAFTRTYDSSRNFQSAALGNGWRHSCEGKVYLTSDLDASFGLRQPTDAVQTIVAALALSDFADTTDSAREMMVGVLTSNWLVNRITNSSANVQLGEQRLTYTGLPDGSWNPPPGSTTALTGASSSFVLQPRFGGSVTFDALNRVSQWKDADNNTQTYAYDSSTGRLATVTDSQSRVLTFTYVSSSSPLIQNVSDGTGRSVTFSYAGNNLTGIQDVEGYNTTLVYNSRNLLEDWKDHSGAYVTRNTYDAQDRVGQQLSQGIGSHIWKFFYSPGITYEVDPLNSTTTYYFDSKNRHVGSIDALGNAFYQYYDGQNHVKVTKDAVGRITWFDYDANQNLTFITDPAGKITRYDYDGSLRLWKITDSTTRVTEFGYDGENHLESIKDPGLRTTHMTYWPDGSLHQITDPDNKTTIFSTYDQWAGPTGVTRADGTTTSAVFNVRGDLTSYTDGRGKATGFGYDKRRLLTSRTDPYLRTSHWTYDSNGNLDTSTDRRNKLTTTVFDNLGHLRTIDAPNTGTVTMGYDLRDLPTTVTDGLNHTTTTGFDLADRPKTLTDARSITVLETILDGAGRVSEKMNGMLQTTKFFYNAAGRLDYTLDPLNRRIDHTYDDAGREHTLKNRRGKTFVLDYGLDGLPTTFTYPSSHYSGVVDRDGVGRPKTMQWTSGQQTGVTFEGMGRIKTLDDGVGSLVWGYDNEGNQTDLTEGAANIHRTFDDVGHVLTCTDISGNTVTYTYDNEGNLETIVYPGNKTVIYTYDGLNRLKTITDWANRLTTYIYDDAGRLTEIDRPNGTRQRLEYYDSNQLQHTYEEKGATPIWDAGYGYDNAYRLTSYTPTPATKTLPPPSAAMTYDDDNRLVTYNGQSVASDGNGNLLAAPISGSVLGALTWDARNRLLTADGVTYVHDAENRRVTSIKSCQTTTYTWSRGGLDRLLVKQNPDGSVTRYIYGLGLLYEETTPSGGGTATTSFYHFNWQGSTIALSDATGNVTARISYSPYGERTVESGTVNTPFCFNGQFGVMTEPNGLLCMQARFYSPVFRRFLSEDPAGFSGGINLYAYTGGDPVNFLDPFGLGPTSALASINNGVCAVLNAVGITAFSNAFYWTVGELGRGAQMLDQAQMSITGVPLDAMPMGRIETGGAAALVAIGAWGVRAEEAAAVVARAAKVEKAVAEAEMLTVRTYTNAAGRAGITSSGVLDANRTWVTLPEEISSRAGHLQIEKLLEIKPGRGANFLELQVPSSNLRIPANGPTVPGTGLWQRRLIESMPIDPSTFRRPPGRPGV